MPEGDTIRRLAERIERRFVGQRVRTTVPRHPRLVGLDLTGARLTSADAVGKHLLLRFDDGRTLHSHLRMDGTWQLGRRAQVHEFHRRLELELENGWLTAVDMPIIGVVPTADELMIVGHLGPDLCGETLPDAATIADRMAALGGDLPLAGALLDQRVVAGFGNVFAVEVPFLAGVSPFHRTADVEGLDDLVAAGAALIRFSTEHGHRNTTGRRLGTSDNWVYGDAGRPCPVCGTKLRGRSADESPWRRVTVWCPECQPGDPDQAAWPVRAVDRSRIDRMLALHPARKSPLLSAR